MIDTASTMSSASDAKNEESIPEPALHKDDQAPPTSGEPKPPTLNDDESGFHGYVSPYRHLTRSSSLPIRKAVGLEASMHAPGADDPASAAPLEVRLDRAIDDLERDSDFQSKPRSDLLLCEDTSVRIGAFEEHHDQHENFLSMTSTGAETEDKSSDKGHKEYEERDDTTPPSEPDADHGEDEDLLLSPIKISEVEPVNRQTASCVVSSHKLSVSHGKHAVRDEDLLTGILFEQDPITTPMIKGPLLSKARLFSPFTLQPFPHAPSARSHEPKMLEFRYPLTASGHDHSALYASSSTHPDPQTTSYNPRSPRWAPGLLVNSSNTYAPSSPSHTPIGVPFPEASTHPTTDLLYKSTLIDAKSPQFTPTADGYSPSTENSGYYPVSPNYTPYRPTSPGHPARYLEISRGSQLCSDNATSSSVPHSQQQTSPDVGLTVADASRPVCEPAHESDYKALHDHETEITNEERSELCKSCVELTAYVRDLTESVKALRSVIPLEILMDIVKSRTSTPSTEAHDSVSATPTVTKGDEQADIEARDDTREELLLATPRQIHRKDALATPRRPRDEIDFSTPRQIYPSSNASFTDESDDVSTISAGSSDTHISIVDTEYSEDQHGPPATIVSGIQDLTLTEVKPQYKRQLPEDSPSSDESKSSSPKHVPRWKRVRECPPPAPKRPYHPYRRREGSTESMCRYRPEGMLSREEEQSVSEILSSNY